MPPNTIMTQIGLAHTDKAIVSYLTKELAPRLEQDGDSELADKIRDISKPCTPEGLKERLIKFNEGELGLRRRKILKELMDLSTDERKDILTYVVNDISVRINLPEVPAVQSIRNMDLGYKTPQYWKAVALASVRAVVA